MKLHKTRRNQRETYKYFDESGNVICEIKPGEKGVTEANISILHLMDDAEVRSNLKYRHGDLKEQKKLAEKWKQEYIEWFRKKYHRMPTEDEIAIAMEDSVPDNWIASIEEMTGDGDADGLGDIPCVFAENLTDAQKRAYILADNQLALNAGWDEEMLSVELSDLKDESFDLSLLGFDEKDLEKLMAGPDDGGAQDDDFDLSAALEKASFVEKGDLWTVGKHRLLCGDATSPEDVERLMGGKTANLILTDPPYGVSFKASDGLTIENDSLKGDEFYKFLLSAFTNMAAHLEKGGAAYVFHADTEGLNFRKAFIDAGFHLAGVCIWVKNSLVLGRSDYQWQHEPILYGFLQNGKHPWYSDRKQTTIWNFNKPKRNKDHPTSKPLDLLSYPIKNSSQENAIVLDTFGGSGSTMMACEQMNRICYMSELDPKYASVILRRYVEDTGDADGVYVERGGKKIPYSDLVKEVETT